MTLFCILVLLFAVPNLATADLHELARHGTQLRLAGDFVSANQVQNV